MSKPHHQTRLLKLPLSPFLCSFQIISNCVCSDI
nr:MAG TPA: hypothetical protein [Caudoviricetes sp.]